MLSFEKYQYAYITCMYMQEDNKPSIYEVALADKLFIYTAVYQTDLAGLKEILEHRLITNYYFESELLRCKDIPVLNVQVDDIKVGTLIEEVAQPEHSFARSIVDFAVGECIFIDSSIVDCDIYKGTAFTKFYNLKFSKSTMSVYFQIVTNNGLVNQHICRFEDMNVEFIPFKLGVPEDSDLTPEFATYLKNMTLNGKVYKVYSVDFLPLVNPRKIQDCIAHKAHIRNIYYANFVKILQEFISRFETDDSQKVVWAGGNSDYSSNYGCFLDSSEKDLTKAEMSKITNYVMTDIFKIYQEQGLDAARKTIARSAARPLVKHCMLLLTTIILNESSIATQVATAIEIKKQYSALYVATGAFLYEVRMLSMKQLIHLGDIRGTFSGSDETALSLASGRALV